MWNKQHSNQGNACVRLQVCKTVYGWKAFAFGKSRLKSDSGKVQLQKVQLGKKKLFTLPSMSSWGKGHRVGVLCSLLEENALYSTLLTGFCCLKSHCGVPVG